MALKIADYWARASESAETADGRQFWLTKLAPSNLSEQNAKAKAEDAVRALKKRILGGYIPKDREYEYGANEDICEDVVEAIKDNDGECRLAITRCKYGALILNTENVLIADIDFAPVPSKGFWATILGRGPSYEERERSVHETALAGVRAYAEANSDTGLRVYRTYAGLRVIVTTALYDATSEASKAVLKSLQSDPLYVALCARQSCYRARLTPKPWRCGVRPPEGAFPRTNAKDRTRFQKWLSRYNRKAESFTACHLLERIGPDAVDPAIQRVIDRHDAAACAEDNVELA